MTMARPDPLVRLTLLYAAALCERGWTQKYHARNRQGDVVSYSDPSATCWCLDGAVMRAANQIYYLHAQWLDAMSEQALATTLGITLDDLVRWNDAPGRRQAEVVTALRAAADGES